MRKILFILICSSVIAACASRKSFFITPNNVNKTKGTIYLRDGTTRNGMISISFENEQEKANTIFIKDDNDTAVEKLDIKNIRSYAINGHTYVVKIINLYLGGEYHYLFVESLTDEKSRMQLYKLLPPAKDKLNEEEPYYYYVSFPHFGEYEVIDINSAKLVPLFDIKMSSYIKDCPDLQDKIRAKEKNYYYTTFSLGSKRIEVIKNIVKEYNECK